MPYGAMLWSSAFAGKEQAAMSRKKWLISILLATLCIGVFVVSSRIWRAVAYQRQVSKPFAARRLAVLPVVIQPGPPQTTDTIDTLYSTFEVPADVFTQLNSHETWLVMRGRQEAEILLTEIGYPNELSPDGNYTFYNDALHTQPVSFWQVLTMSDAEYESHARLIVGRIATPFADRGVSFFRTTTTKGIIRYGSEEHFADVINIIIWDNVRAMSQEITITVSDPELRRQTALSIAATYRFTLDTIPDRSELLLKVRQAVERFRSEAD